MPKEPIKVLGVNPGTRYIGMACFEDRHLLDWGIKSFNGRWCRQKSTKVIETIASLIDYHQPNVISVKKLHPSRSSKNLIFVTEEVFKQAKKRRLRIRKYTIGEIKEYFSPDKKANREKIAEMLVDHHPALWHELQKERKNNTLYHLRTFEAVALAAICLDQLTR